MSALVGTQSDFCSSSLVTTTFANMDGFNNPSELSSFTRTFIVLLVGSNTSLSLSIFPLKDLPGFDCSSLLAMLDGDEAQVTNFLRSFRDNNVGTVKKLETAIDTKDFNAAWRLVHTLVGTAGTLGSKHFASVAEPFDISLRQERFDQASYDAFMRALVEMMSQLEKLG